MKILRLENQKIIPAIAEIHTSKGKRYFNVKHGLSGRNFWKWSACLDYLHFKPKTDDTKLELSGDDYIISPIRKNKEILKDVKGNVLYNITKDQMSTHKSDVLLLWDIPNKNFKDVTFTTEGMCNLIGEGSTGRVRGDDVYKSPSPVVEILGDCVLVWVGYAIDGTKYRQEVKYSYNDAKFNIGTVMKVKEEKTKE